MGYKVRHALSDFTYSLHRMVKHTQPVGNTLHYREAKLDLLTHVISNFLRKYQKCTHIKKKEKSKQNATKKSDESSGGENVGQEGA